MSGVPSVMQFYLRYYEGYCYCYTTQTHTVLLQVSNTEQRRVIPIYRKERPIWNRYEINKTGILHFRDVNLMESDEERIIFGTPKSYMPTTFYQSSHVSVWLMMNMVAESNCCWTICCSFFYYPSWSSNDIATTDTRGLESKVWIIDSCSVQTTSIPETWSNILWY